MRVFTGRREDASVNNFGYFFTSHEVSVALGRGKNLGRDDVVGDKCLRCIIKFEWVSMYCLKNVCYSENMSEIIKFPTIQKPTSPEAVNKDKKNPEDSKVLRLTKREKSPVQACLFEGSPHSCRR